MRRLVIFLNTWFLNVDDADRYITYFIDFVDKSIRTRGIDNTILRVKTMKLAVTRFISGHPLSVSGEPSISLNRRGLPRALGPLQDLVDKGVGEHRLLLTLLSVSRALPGSRYVPSLSTITDSSTMDIKTYEELKFLIPMVMNQMGLDSNPSQPRWKKFHLTTKAGPNAIALKSAMIDIHLLPEDLREDIYTVGGPSLKEQMKELLLFDKDKIYTSMNFKKSKEDLKIRKLSIVHAPERKSRIIAILDYFSQTALKPLHDRIFKILESLEGDCTFRQNKPQMFLTKEEGNSYHSLDLTAATDRFPIEVQETVIANLVGSSQYAAAWKRILTKHEFFVPWDSTYVKYNAGQPMGAYSSWAVFALSHHIIVRTAALKVGKPYYTNYALLGDDIVIGNDAVAAEYKKLIQSLGVQISDSKSHVSEDTYEFAKRWVKANVEITGAQINAFVESTKWYLLANEYKNLCIKWGTSLKETEPGVVKDLFYVLNPRLQDRYRERLASKTLAFLSLPWDRPGEDRGELIVQFVRTIYPTILGCFSNSKVRAKEWFYTSVSEIKARILEKALLHARGQALAAIKSAKPLIQCYRGVDAQSAFSAIPSNSIIAQQFETLTSDIDDLRDPLVTTPEKLLFSQVRYLAFDGTRIMVERPNRILLALNATLVNQLRAWTRLYDGLINELSAPTTDLNRSRAIARLLYRTKVIGAVMPGFPLSGGEEIN